jgi:hypothetical protein
MLGITTTNARVGGFRGGISAEAKTIYNRIIADGGVSNLTRLNFFVKGLKSIYGDLANVPVCYDAHWIGYKLGSGTGATAGQAAAKLYSLTVAGDAVQATAASQPLLLAHNGASSDNYWYGSGVTGNYVSTPNAVANQITGDIEIVAKINRSTLSPASKICAKWSGANGLYYFDMLNGGYLRLSINNAVAGTSSIVSPITDFVNYFVKVTRVSLTGVINFYTSTDGITYNQLGATINGTAGVINNANIPLEIGAFNLGVNDAFQGKISRVTISNSIGGTPVVDFNPATYNASTSQTQWTSATGEVWTINTGTATTGYKGVLVSRTIVQGDGVDDTLISSTLASRQYFTSILSVKMAVTANKTILGSTLDSHLIYTASNLWRAYNGIEITGSAANTTLNMVTINFNNLTSSFILNANTPVTGITGLQTSTNVKLFGGASSFGNCTINTVLQSLAVIDSTQQTATYNLIRSLNENAF